MFVFRAKRILVLGLVSIWRHRLRSALTILGIVFGVCSVIAMLAIGEGASYEAQQQIKNLGSQNILVYSVKPPASESASTEASRLLEYGLTYADADRIRATIPGIEVIVPSRTIRADVIYRRTKLEANVIGTVPWHPEVANLQVGPGRFFSSEEMTGARNVAVLSAELARRLFVLDDPLHSTIGVQGDYYTVIGVMAPVTTGAAQDAARLALYIPLTAAKARFGEIIARRSAGSYDVEKVELHQITAKVADLEAVPRVAAIIGDLLKRFHNQVDYEIVVPLELLREAERSKRIFSIVLGSIAAISLLVGGIGIMNIMLASVTERTREIGIRRALGAKKADIIVQFLSETVLLAGSGGAIGLAVGVVIPLLVTHFADMVTIVRWWSLFGAFGISVLIGIVFGLYPAYRAAQMNPISALRHE